MYVIAYFAIKSIRIIIIIIHKSEAFKNKLGQPTQKLDLCFIINVLKHWLLLLQEKNA